MKDRWDKAFAAGLAGPLEACAYASRLVGADESLVVHGGGNSSIKLAGTDLFGDPTQVLWVKASGWDMASLGSAGFAPVDLPGVRRLAELPALSDAAMMNALRAALVDATAPDPSVETILHAVISGTVVLHAHPDVLLAVSNTADGDERLAELYGEDVVIVDYAMSGFRAAKQTAEYLDKYLTDKSVGLVLAHHGIFTFGDTPRQAYQRMVDLIGRAEDYCAKRRTSNPAAPAGTGRRGAPPNRTDLARFRARVSAVAKRPMILRRHTDDAVLAFCERSDLAEVTAEGPATPDHVIWTKRTPLVGRNVEEYAAAYRDYFQTCAAGRDLQMLDPAPRVALDREWGLVTFGPDVKAAAVAADIYRHTIDIINTADGLGGYSGLSAADIFDLEYWELEQAKLDRLAETNEFTGEVAVVTGAASGIGRACAHELLARGSAVIGIDIDPAVAELTDHDAFLGMPADVSCTTEVGDALDAGVSHFGGVDMVVAAAGLFPESAPIAAHDPVAWRRAMSVNTDGLVQLLAAVHPLLKSAPRGGRVAVIGSKNVAAPGPGASAYSASKAAANQIARVAALEWATDGIRVNSVHPDAIFDTGLWTDALLTERAARYDMTVEQYKRRNLLGTEIPSASVANVVATMLGGDFAHVTGAHIPIDGGNERVI